MSAALKLETPIFSLVEGYKKFKENYYEKDNSFEHLVEHGQKPHTLIIACCDSRVDPAIMTGCEPGELFVVRNVANLVPPYDHDPKHHGTSAAIEFAVEGLGVQNIIILGHRYCGGIRALVAGQEKPDHPTFVDSWMDIAAKAKKKAIDNCPHGTVEDQAHQCEKDSLTVSLDNLMTFPWVKEGVDKGTLSLHAWYFDLKSGEIEAYDQGEKTFLSL